MIVTWKDRMMFDGRTAHFEHSVDGQSKSRKFKTDLLDVSLRHRIDFAQPRMDERAEIDRIVCHGGMWMETRSFDPYDPKKLMSIDRMQTGRLVDQRRQRLRSWPRPRLADKRSPRLARSDAADSRRRRKIRAAFHA